jgi:hypothetical protein
MLAAGAEFGIKLSGFVKFAYGSRRMIDFKKTGKI